MAIVERNQFINLPEMPYKIINYLVDNNEIIWKLLKYPNHDALLQSNLSIDDKTALIYGGQEDSTTFRMFPQSFVDDGVDTRRSMIFIDIGKVIPENYVQGIVHFYIDVISHNKMQTLIDRTNRNIILMHQIITTLNGADVLGVGEMFFNNSRGGNNSANLSYYNTIYQGYRIIMSCNV